MGCATLLLLLGAIVVPYVQEGLNRSAQRRTEADMQTIAAAWEARATDRNYYSILHDFPDSENLPAVSAKDLRDALAPTYVKSMPIEDGWGRPFEFSATHGQYVIRSKGRDGRRDDVRLASRATTSFDCDLIYSNGTFLEYPEGS